MPLKFSYELIEPPDPLRLSMVEWMKLRDRMNQMIEEMVRTAMVAGSTPLPAPLAHDVRTGVLVLGGPRDGEWVALPPGQQTFSVAVPVGPFTLERADYRVMELAGEHDRYTVLVPDGWTADQTLRALIEGYQGDDV